MINLEAEFDLKREIRVLILGSLLVLVCACGSFLTGDSTTDPKTGETSYEEAPMVPLAEAIGGIFGVGAIAGAAARMLRNASRTKNALYETNKQAIEDANWSKINSAESFKKLLKLKQDSHDDSVLLRKEYKKYKKAKEIKEVKAKV